MKKQLLWMNECRHEIVSYCISSLDKATNESSTVITITNSRINPADSGRDHKIYNVKINYTKKRKM